MTIKLSHFSFDHADADRFVNFSFAVDAGVPININKIITDVSYAMLAAVATVEVEEIKEDAVEVPAESSDAPEDAKPAAKPRRTRKKADEAEAKVDDGAAPKRRRRRASTAGADSESVDVPGSADDGAEDAPAAEPKPRRRRKASKEDATDAAPDVATVDIAEVMSAASRAAEVITPKGVQEIIEEFGVASLDKLTPEQATEFLDRMISEMENANG
jgi:hypothetical protein